MTAAVAAPVGMVRLSSPRPRLTGHGPEVAQLALAVCRRLGLRPVATSRVHRAALLHDVGKVSVPRELLDRPGPLGDADWRVVREHPVVGEQLARAFPWLADAALLVRHHHERWDGTGYPDGLRGEEIPLGARIIAACDAYDAMVAERPYRAALSPAEAVERLRADAGAQFDPAVVMALVDVLEGGGTEGPLWYVR